MTYLTLNYEIDLLAALADEIGTREEFSSVLMTLDKDIFQDWSYTEAGLMYYLDTCIETSNELMDAFDDEERLAIKNKLEQLISLL